MQIQNSHILLGQGTVLGGIFHPDMHKLTKPMLLSLQLPGNRVERPGTVEYEALWLGRGWFIRYSFDVADRIIRLSTTYIDDPTQLNRTRARLVTEISRELVRGAEWIWEGLGVSAAIWGGVEPGEPLKLSVSYWNPAEPSAPVPQP